jgi:hypothetical protein
MKKADKFRPGQRVRIVARNTRLKGKTATILTPRALHEVADGKDEGQLRYMYDVNVDGEGTGLETDGIPFGFEEHELELAYDGDMPGSWAEVERMCGWRPRRAKTRRGG